MSGEGWIDSSLELLLLYEQKHDGETAEVPAFQVINAAYKGSLHSVSQS